MIKELKNVANLGAFLAALVLNAALVIGFTKLIH